MTALLILAAFAVGYLARWAQVALRPEIAVTGWQIKRCLNRNRAVFRRSVLARQ